MYHNFNVEIAERLGVDEAILLHNLAFWVLKNKTNEKHYHEGCFWTYNSARAFEEFYPYWNATKIGRMLRELERIGVIKSGNFNKHKYDRTKWYTIIEKSILQEYKIELVKNNDETLKPEGAIPYSEHSSQQHIVNSTEDVEDITLKNESQSTTEIKKEILEFKDGFKEHHAEAIYKEFPDAKKPHDSRNILKDILQELENLANEFGNNPERAFDYLLETTKDIAEIFPRMNKYDKKFMPYARKWFKNQRYKDIKTFETKVEPSVTDRGWIPPSERRKRENQSTTSWGNQT